MAYPDNFSQAAFDAAQGTEDEDVDVVTEPTMTEAEEIAHYLNWVAARKVLRSMEK